MAAAADVLATCKKNQKLNGAEDACVDCAEYEQREGDTTGSGNDAGKCQLTVCSGDTGVLKVSLGVCATTRATCNGEGTASDYWYVDKDADNKCKERAACSGADDGKVIQVDGTCKTAGTACGDYYKENTVSNPKKCDRGSCDGDKGVKKDGSCSTNRDDCDGTSAYYFIDTDDHRRCKVRTTAMCVKKSDKTPLVKLDGTCIDKCQNYWTAIHANGLKQCYDPKCKDKSPALWTNFDGSCVENGKECAAYSKKDATDAKKCIKDDCGADKYLKADASCATSCTDYTERKETVDTVKKCVAADCGDKVVAKDGTCIEAGKECPQNFRTGSDANAKKCIQDDCSGVEGKKWLDLKGNCVASCPTKTYGEDVGKLCKQDTCNALQILLDTGKCEKCGPFIRANAENTACETEEFTCPKAREYMAGEGKCQVCPKFSKVAANDKSCDEVTCSDVAKPAVTEDGDCVATDKCPAYTVYTVTGDKKQCITKVCSGEVSKKWTGQDGKCYIKAECPSYSYGDDDDGKLCKTDTCPITSKLTTGGKCEACTTYQNAKADPKTCAVTDCTGKKKTPDGLCHDSCPEFYVDNADVAGTCKVATDPCKDAQVDWFDDGGTCKETCPEYDLADSTSATWKKCVTVPVKTCTDAGKVLGRDGKCVENCPNYEKKNADTSKCEAPIKTCKDHATDKILGLDGVCVAKCPAYQELDATDANDQKCKPATETCYSDATKKIVGLDGKCVEKCPDYDALDESGGIARKKCVAGASDCAASSKVLGRDGKCTTDCPTHEFKNADTKKCDLVSCDKEPKKKLLKRDGVCAEACPDYDLAADSKCTVPAACANKLHIDGTCPAACPEFFMDGADSFEGKCVARPNTCGSGDDSAKPYQKPVSDFSCVAACEDYQFADATKKQCQTVKCESGQKLSVDGKCGSECPEFFKEDAGAGAGKCIAITNKCKDAKDGKTLLVAAKDECVATGGCPDYLKEDAANNKCVTTSCADEETNKVLKLDGVCAAKCPEYEFNNKNKCEKKECEKGKDLKLSLVGTCAAACPEFSEDANTDGKCTAFANTCGEAAAYQTGDKSCVAKCGEYLFTDATPKRCAKVVCEGAQVLKKDGTCADKCTDYDKKDKDGKCVKSVCDDVTDKLLKKDGSCAAACAPYDKIDADGKKCETAAVCEKKLTVTGECLDACPEFYKAGDGADAKKCVAKLNGCKDKADTPYAKPDDSCTKTCADYTFTDDTLKQCQTPACKSWVTIKGVCVAACPQLTAEFTDGGAKKCKPKTNDCKGEKPYFQDSKDVPCVAECPADSYVRGVTVGEKKSCVQDICGDGEVLQKADGTCKKCAEYTKKTGDKTCAADKCEARNRLKKDGTCTPCEDYLVTKPDSESKVCEQPLCKEGEAELVNSVVGADGACKKCDDYFKAAANKRDCVPGVLTEAQPATQWILQKDGTAKECEYAKPDADSTAKVNGVTYKNACKDTTCETDAKTGDILRKYISKTGDCVVCGDYEKRDPADAKKCVKQTCTTAGWVPDLKAVCVDPQDTLILAITPPAGVTPEKFEENVKAARDGLKLLLTEVKASLKALQASLSSAIKVAFGLV